jgi:hypothetical protein
MLVKSARRRGALNSHQESRKHLESEEPHQPCDEERFEFRRTRTLDRSGGSKVGNLREEDGSNSLDDDGNPDDLDEGDEEKPWSCEEDPRLGLLKGGENDPGSFERVPGEEVRSDDRSEGGRTKKEKRGGG